MANPWFKFYGGEYLSDTKILQLTASERSCWITLLCLANQSGNGTVRFLSENQLLVMAGATELVSGILRKFEDLDMIRICNDNVTVINWEKRQESFLTNAERQAKFRGKSKKSNDPRYESNARIEENRIDKNRNTNTASNEAKVNTGMRKGMMLGIKDLI